jgi:hypothetical protein
VRNHEAVRLTAFIVSAVAVEALVSLAKLRFSVGGALLVLVAIMTRAPWTWLWFTAIGSVSLLPRIAISDSPPTADRITVLALIMLSMSLIRLVQATRRQPHSRETLGEHPRPARNGEPPGASPPDM